MAQTKSCPSCRHQTALWSTHCLLCGYLFSAPASVSPALRDMARLKSYTGPCVVVIVLYCFLFVPGLVANWLFLEDARRTEALAGEPLPGVSGLRGMWTAMLWAGSALALMLIALLIASALTPRA